MWVWIAFKSIVRVLASDRTALIAEILALRQQLAILQHKAHHVRLRHRNRILGLAVPSLVRLAFRFRHRPTQYRRLMAPPGLQTLLALEEPASAKQAPAVGRDIRKVIRRMAEANPLWGAPRTHGEILKLGIEISQATVVIVELVSQEPRF